MNLEFLLFNSCHFCHYQQPFIHFKENSLNPSYDGILLLDTEACSCHLEDIHMVLESRFFVAFALLEVPRVGMEDEDEEAGEIFENLHFSWKL